MVSVRKSAPAQSGKKTAFKTLLDVPEIATPPYHFDDLACELWDYISNFPNFVHSAANYQALAAALDGHIIFRRISAEIADLRKKGRQPENRLLLAQAAARRPLAKFLKQLVITC
jgi:hypothetical protein